MFGGTSCTKKGAKRKTLEEKHDIFSIYRNIRETAGRFKKKTVSVITGKQENPIWETYVKVDTCPQIININLEQTTNLQARIKYSNYKKYTDPLQQLFNIIYQTVKIPETGSLIYGSIYNKIRKLKDNKYVSRINVIFVY